MVSFERPEVDYVRDPDIKPSGLSREQIERVAGLVASVLRIKVGDFLDEPIRRVLGGKVHARPVHLWTEPGSVYVHGPNEFDIVTEALASDERRRFTIAHELGHYFLHAAQGQIPLIANRLGTGPAERECNSFAAALLMPEKELRDEIERGKLTCEEIATKFGVSVAALAVRKQILGIA